LPPGLFRRDVESHRARRALERREALREPVQNDEADDGYDRGHGGNLIFFVINFLIVVLFVFVIKIVFDIAQFIAISLMAATVANVRAVAEVGVRTD
jgi:hypothetical protein